MSSSAARLLLVSAALVLASAPVFADRAEPSAKVLVEAADQAKAAKQYDKAIGLYQQAYRLEPVPILIFRVGQTHGLAGRTDQAARFYERYLTLDPDGSEAAAARELLTRLGRPIPKPAPAIEPGGGAAEPDGDPGAGAAIGTGAGAPRDPGPPRDPERRRRSRTMSLAGVGLITAGVVAGFAGTALVIQEKRGVGIGVGAGGAALAITGVVLFYRGRSYVPAARVTAAPMIGDGFAGVALAGAL